MRVLSLLAVVGLSLCGPLARAEGPLILEYRFNSDGPRHSPDVGPDKAALVIKTAENKPFVATEKLETGISGATNDRAIDFSSATGMGMGSSGPFARIEDADTARILDGLTSFTVSGWIKAEEVIGNTVEFLHKMGRNKEGLDSGWKVTLVPKGRLRLFVNDQNLISERSDWARPGEWVFFAITYDGTLKSNNASFYFGTKNDPVILSSSQTLVAGPTKPNDVMLFLSRPDRPFRGLIDNIRIRGATSGSEGALSEKQLESIRASDIIQTKKPD